MIEWIPAISVSLSVITAIIVATRWVSKAPQEAVDKLYEQLKKHDFQRLEERLDRVNAKFEERLDRIEGRARDAWRSTDERMDKLTDRVNDLSEKVRKE